MIGFFLKNYNNISSKENRETFWQIEEDIMLYLARMTTIAI